MKNSAEKTKVILTFAVILLLILAAFIIFWVGSRRVAQAQAPQSADADLVGDSLRDPASGAWESSAVISSDGLLRDECADVGLLDRG